MGSCIIEPKRGVVKTHLNECQTMSQINYTNPISTEVWDFDLVLTSFGGCIKQITYL